MIKKWLLPENWIVFVATGIMLWAFGLPIAMLTQASWAPFDRVEGVQTDREVYAPGDQVIITWDLYVHKRYPASFESHLINMDTGKLYDWRRHPAATGKLGAFVLPQVRRIPDDAPTGQWCYVVTGKVDYNVLLSTVRVYPPVCFEVR